MIPPPRTTTQLSPQQKKGREGVSHEAMEQMVTVLTTE
jgi:hypothetical protein